jgi:hypothetical protein
MSRDIENPSLVELLDRLDLSSMSETEVIRLRAEAARAEYISEALHNLFGKVKSLFCTCKNATTTADVSHA